MKSHDKAFLISGMMYNVVFFLLMLAELVITKAAGYALFSALATYLFFDTCYYVKKDWKSLQRLTVRNLKNYTYLKFTTK